MPFFAPRLMVTPHAPRSVFLVILLLLAAAVGGPALRAQAPATPAKNLADLLKRDNLWQLKQADFEPLGRPYGFTWTSQEKTSARTASKDLRLHDLPVVEALAGFEGGVVTNFKFMLYDHGDVGDLSPGNFEALVTKATTTLSTATGARPKDLDKMGKEGLAQNARLWVQAPLAYRLEWSSTRDKTTKENRPDYVRVEVFATNAQGGVSLVVKRPKAISARDLQQNIKKLPTGDVYIDNVPMVDQGQKGYCAVAVCERVLQYYGREVDEHDIAAAAGTGGGGTNFAEMLKALHRVADKLGIQVQMRDDFDMREFSKLYTDYNAAAKKAKKPELAPLPTSGSIEVGSIYRQFDPEILTAALMHNKAKYDKFVKDVHTTVDSGVPLIWSVQLGLVKEAAIPQAFGGHMRLIIGYNAKTDEILYTDTWGKGHELKRLATKDAFTMNLASFVMKPD